jgi:hypothetical protein
MCSPYEVRCARAPTSLLWSQLFPVPGPINWRRYVRSGLRYCSARHFDLIRIAHGLLAGGIRPVAGTPRAIPLGAAPRWLGEAELAWRRHWPVRGAGGRLIEGLVDLPYLPRGPNQTL